MCSKNNQEYSISNHEQIKLEQYPILSFNKPIKNESNPNTIPNNNDKSWDKPVKFSLEQLKKGFYTRNSKVVDLKEELNEHGCSKTGKKSILSDRLKTHYNQFHKVFQPNINLKHVPILEPAMPANASNCLTKRNISQ